MVAKTETTAGAKAESAKASAEETAEQTANTATAEGADALAESGVESPGADGVIRRYMYWSAGAGLIPIMVVDAAALIAVQLRMLQQLSNLYGIPFKENTGKSAVGALLATATAHVAGYGTLSLILRNVPLVGGLAMVLTKPAFSAAFTYAVGKVFNQHFASGGTFLTFDPDKVEDYFKEKFEEGKAEVKSATKAAA